MAVESCDFWIEPFVFDVGLSQRSEVAFSVVNQGSVRQAFFVESLLPVYAKCLGRIQLRYVIAHGVLENCDFWPEPFVFGVGSPRRFVVVNQDAARLAFLVESR